MELKMQTWKLTNQEFYNLHLNECLNIKCQFNKFNKMAI